MKLVPEQQMALDSFVHENRPTFVTAVPGAGKTTLLVETLTQYTKKNPTHNILVLAFNTDANKELEKRGPKSKNIAYKTTYALGYAINAGYYWRNFWKKGNPRYKSGTDKTSYTLHSVVGDFENAYAEKKKYENLWKYSDLCLVYSLEDFLAVCSRLKLDNDGEKSWKIVQQLRQESHRSYENAGNFTMEEMLFLSYEYRMEEDIFPIRMGNKKNRQEFHHVDAIFIDEVQDLSPAQFELVCALDCPNIFAVGDQQQAINHFAASMVDSQATFLERFPEMNVVEVPVTFRFGPAICDFVNSLEIHGKKVNGRVKPFSDKSGEILRLSLPEALRRIQQESVLILGRNFRGKDSDLLAVIHRLIAEQISFSIRGFEIADLIQPLVEVMTKENIPLDNTVMAGGIAIEKQLDSDTFVDIKEYRESLEFMADIIRGIAPFISSPSQINDYVNKKFGKGNSNIIVSTIHKAKGSEAETVILMNFNRFPYLKGGESDVEIQSERNVLNVAATRSKSTLILVNSQE